jgi:hypothetical protein
MRRVLYTTAISLERKEYERDVFIDELLNRLNIVNGSAYINTDLGPFAQGVVRTGGSWGIVSNFKPTKADNLASLPFSLYVDGSTLSSLIVNPGVAVFKTGEIIQITNQVSGVIPASGQAGDISVIYLQFDELETDTVLSRYNAYADTTVKYLADPASYIKSLALSQWNTLSPIELEDKIPIGVVSILSDGSFVVDQTTASLATNRPWFSPVDIEHRSHIGSGVVTETNIHGLSLNDLSVGNNTLLTLLCDTGMVVAKDNDIAKVPGFLCTEVIKKESVNTDTNGSITGIVGAYYFYVSKYPTQLVRVTISNAGVPFESDPNIYGQYNSDNTADIAGSLVPNRNIVVLLPSDQFIITDNTLPIPVSTPQDLRVQYLATQALSPDNTSPTISGALTFKDKANLVDETIVAGGLAIGSPSTSMTLGDCGQFPQKYTCFMLGDGNLYKTPQVVFCYSKLLTMGLVAQGITINQLYTAPVKVGLTQAGLGASQTPAPTMKVTVQIKGVDANDSPLTSVLTFYGNSPGSSDQNWLQDIDVQTDVTELNIMNSRLYRTFTDQPDGTGNVLMFKKVTSVQLLENTDTNTDAAIMLWADINPVAGVYVAGSNLQVGSMLPVLSFVWDGIQVKKDDPTNPKAGQPLMYDMRPVNTTFHLPRASRYGSGLKAMFYDTPAQYVKKINDQNAPWKASVTTTPFPHQCILEDFDRPKFITNFLGDHTRGSVKTSGVFYPEPSFFPNNYPVNVDSNYFFRKSKTSKLGEGLVKGDVYISRPIPFKPYNANSNNNKPLFTRFVPIGEGPPDKVFGTTLLESGFSLWARVQVWDKVGKVWYWSTWNQVKQDYNSFSVFGPQYIIDYHSINLVVPAYKPYPSGQIAGALLDLGNGTNINTLQDSPELTPIKVQFICTGPVRGMMILHYLGNAEGGKPGVGNPLIYDNGIFDSDYFG